jgi:hypothetical protein
MGWLRGSTDVTNVAADLYGLLGGNLAASNRGSGQAGNGVTLGGGDLWTPIDATNRVLRSTATNKIARGEVACWRGMPRFSVGDPTSYAQSSVTLGKPTFSGAYSGGTVRVFMLARVTTINSAAGNLTGTVVTWRLVNADTNANVTADATVSGWAGTTDTKLLGQGISLTLTLIAGEQFVANNVFWYRGYTTTLTQGVDFIPEACRVKTTNTINLSNASGGSNTYTQATDYTVVQDGDPYPNPTTKTGSTSTVGGDSAGSGCMMGIHWITGGAPPAAGTNYYLVDCDLYACYLRIAYAAGLVYFCPLEFWDPVRGYGKGIFGGANAAGTTAAAVFTATQGVSINVTVSSGANYINYWMSVKPEKVIILLRGDPGNSGTYSVVSLQKYTPQETADKEPWCLENCVTVGNTGSGFMHPWFTYDYPYWGPTSSIGQGSDSGRLWNSFGPSSAPSQVPAINPNTPGLKWYLWPIWLLSRSGGKNTSGVYSNVAGTEAGWLGYLLGIYAINATGWSFLDELVSGADTYLLVALTGSLFIGGGAANFAIKEE